MSHLFYDHLIDLSELEEALKASAEESEEREELWNLVDEIIHHRVLGCIFDHLPNHHHEEFLTKIHATPHQDDVLHFLREKVGTNIEEIIKQELGLVTHELLQDLK